MEDNRNPRPQPLTPRRGVMDVRARTPASPRLPQPKPLAPTPSEPQPPMPPVPPSPPEESSHFVPPPPVPEQKPAKNTAPKLAIVLAFLIAIVLAGLTGAAYYYTRDPAEPKEETHEQTTTEPAQEADVEEATTEVDEALDDTPTEDFPESELSDQTLGL